MLGNARHRTMRLEDGEQVVMLHRARKAVAFPSSQPHAGLWGRGQGYVLVPHPHPPRRAASALAFQQDLTDRSSDTEVLLLGPVDSIRRLIDQGPTWCRARVRAVVAPGRADAMIQFRFRPASQHELQPLETNQTPSRDFPPKAEAEPDAETQSRA